MKLKLNFTQIQKFNYANETLQSNSSTRLNNGISQYLLESVVVVGRLVVEVVVVGRVVVLVVVVGAVVVVLVVVVVEVAVVG